MKLLYNYASLFQWNYWVNVRDRAPVRGRTLVFDPAPDRALVRDSALVRDRALYRALDPDRDFPLAIVLDVQRITELIDLSFLKGSFIQEAFFPDLSASWPHLACDSLSGRIGDAVLAGPGLAEFELEQDSRRVHFTDPDGMRPEALSRRGYDLTFPMVAVPLGALRRGCPAWRTDRRVFPLGVAPFLFPDLHEVWPRHAEVLRSLFIVPRIFTLLPRVELWSKPFADWTPDEWENCGLSALWDIDTGRVLWAQGAHHVDEMPNVGREANDFFGKGKKPRKRRRPP